MVAADLHHDLQPFKTQVEIMAMIFIMVMVIKLDLHTSHGFVLKPTDFSDGPAAGSQRRSGGEGDCTGKPDGKIVKEKYLCIISKVFHEFYFLTGY